MNEQTEQVNQTEQNNQNVVKKSKLRHVAVIIIAILALLGVAYLAWNKLFKKKPVDYTALPAVNVTTVKRGSIKKDVSVVGSILPNETYYVPVKVGGEITKIYVKNGDVVKKGDPICEIDASKEIEAAFIQYDTAKKAYERMDKLYRSGDISLQNLETVKAQYDAAKLSYDTKVEYSTPVAAGDGVVENTDMTLNTSVKAEKVLCYITSDEAKEINFGVTERVLSGINLGDPVVIEKNGKTYNGMISDVANLINSQNGLFNCKAVITTPNNFASGIMAKVTLTYEKKDNVNILPNEIVYYENGRAFVYTVSDDNTITKKYIEIGIENKDESEIVSGIDSRTKIIATWTSDLAEGTLVNVVNGDNTLTEKKVAETKVSDTKNVENKKNDKKEPDTKPVEAK